MNANELIEFTQRCLDNGEIEKIVAQYRSLPPDFSQTSETATLTMIFLIYEHEKAIGEVSFLEGRSTISELIDCYDQLKFYLRRYDFDVHYDTTEFVEFVKRNHISSAAVLAVAQMSTIYQVKVLNAAAMTLLDNKEYVTALRILGSVVENSQDDMTLFNLAQAFYCCEQYETAYEMVELIKIKTPLVNALKTRIQEKLL